MRLEALQGALALALFAHASAGCSRPLPESDSPGATAYVRECGVCHVAIHPGMMTAAMWDLQIKRMEEIRRRRGMPQITPHDLASIEAYLRAHAG